MTTINIERAAQDVSEGVWASGGATVSIVTGVRPPTTGYGVSLAGFEHVSEKRAVGRKVAAYADKHAAVLAKPNHYLGAWVDRESGKLYLDITEVFAERVPAIRAGIARQQLAIWDYSDGEEIRLDNPTSPLFPEGTPEHAAYAAELRAELAKFVAGEGEYSDELATGLAALSWDERAQLDSGQPIGKTPHQVLLASAVAHLSAVIEAVVPSTTAHFAIEDARRALRYLNNPEHYAYAGRVRTDDAS